MCPLDFILCLPLHCYSSLLYSFPAEGPHLPHLFALPLTAHRAGGRQCHEVLPIETNHQIIHAAEPGSCSVFVQFHCHIITMKTACLFLFLFFFLNSYNSSSNINIINKQNKLTMSYFQMENINNWKRSPANDQVSHCCRTNFWTCLCKCVYAKLAHERYHNHSQR